MTLGQSINTCFAKYATFSGRATMSELWWWVFFVFFCSFVLNNIHATAALLFSLVTLVPSFAVTARRLHDSNRSGWWQLVGLVPFIGWCFVVYWCVQPAKEPNRFGQAAGNPA